MPREKHSVPMRGHVKAMAVAIGAAIGIVLGMTSVGSGALGNILAGSLPGVWLGSALMPYAPARTLRLALGCTLLGSALAVSHKRRPISVLLPSSTLPQVMKRSRPSRSSASSRSAACVTFRSSALGTRA
jgi:uncharacterized membrane protein YfcA